MNIWTPLVLSFLLLVCKASKPKAHDDRCRITLHTTISKCSLQRWYLDKATKQCLESCDPAAPFSTKIECEGTCRNGEVCDYPMAGAFCFGEVFPVYVFNPTKKRCFLTYDCSYFGNKFPTLGECQRTCEKRNGSIPYPGQTDNTISQSSSQSKGSAGSASGTIQTATGTGSPLHQGLTNNSIQQVSRQPTTSGTSGLPAQQTATGTRSLLHQGLTDNSIAQVSSQPTTSGTSGLPAQQTAAGTGSVMLPGQLGNAIQQVTSQSSRATVGSELPAHATASAAGEQPFGGSTATSTHIGGSAANSNQAVGVGEATTSQSQSTLVTGIAGAQTAHEQQDVTYTTGSSQQACTPPCNFNMSFVQQGALQPNLTAVKIQARPKGRRYDRRCKVIATLPTYKCGLRWFFNKRTGTCLPSCSRKAPFRSKLACDGICQSVEVCDFPMASIPCFREVHEVFIYNSNQNSCFKAYDCSYFGNKFPTLQQCQTTCTKGASQQHLAGSAAGASLASTQMQNSGSIVGLKLTSPNSGTSLGPGRLGTQIGASQHASTNTILTSSQAPATPTSSNAPGGQLTGPSLAVKPNDHGLGMIKPGGAQQQIGNSAASISQVSGQTSNSDTTASHQAGQSLSGMSTGSVLGGYQPGTAQVSTTSLEGSAQSSGSGSLLIQQHGQTGPVLTPQQAALGAADQQVSAVLGSSANTSGQISLSVPHAHNQRAPSISGQSTATSPSGHRQGAAQVSTSSLLASSQGSGNTSTQSIHQHGQTVPDLLTRQAALGAAQHQITNVVASSAQASGSAVHSGSTAGDLPAPSLSATSTGSGLVGQQLGTAQVSTSFSSSSTQVAGSTSGLLAQQLAQTGAGVVAGQPSIGSAQGSANLAQSSSLGSGLPNIVNVSGNQKPSSTQPINPSGSGYVALQPDKGKNELTGSQSPGQTNTSTSQHRQNSKEFSLKNAYDDRCKNTYGLSLGNCTTKRWYYDRRTRECRPSCNTAVPFIAKIDCDGVCRSSEACDFPMARLFCLRLKHVIYIYNPNKRRCFQAHDCSYYGNKFPTFGECQRTCVKKQKLLTSSPERATQASGHTNNLVTQTQGQPGAGLLTGPTAIGSAQNQLPSSTGSISQSSSQMSTSESRGSDQLASSQSGTSTGTGIVAAGPEIELTKPVAGLAQTTAVHPVIQKPMVPALSVYGISSEDKATHDVKSIKK